MDRKRKDLQQTKTIDPDFKSFCEDNFTDLKDTRICHDCLNNLFKLPPDVWEKIKITTGCDVFENVDDVNEAIESNHCDFYIKKESV